MRPISAPADESCSGTTVMSALVTIAGLAILLLAVNAIVMLTMTRTAEMAASVESFLDSRAQTFE